MAIKRPGAYTPLAANYADDEAIMAAGEDAELMYVRILAYCGRTPKTEGFISDKQIRTRLGIETRPEVGPETAPERRAERLSAVGLLVRERDGYRVKNWLKWNASRDEMQRKQAQDRNSKAASSRADTRTTPRNVPRKGTRSDALFDTAETETETETETSTALAPLDAPKRSAQTLVGEYVDACPQPPARRVIGQVAKEVGDLLREGIDYERVRQGLADWSAKGQHPSTIPSFVSAVGNTRPSNGRQRETDDMFERAAARMAAREAAGQ